MQYIIVIYNIYVIIYIIDNGGNIMKKLITLCAILFTVVFIVWGIIRIVAYYQFSVGCGQYLQRAATANSISLASSNLDTAISYLENRNLTSGQVSIFLHQPKNDITYWYSNLKSAQSELKNMSPDATQLEVSNELMKIKETLVSNTSDGEVLIYPEGIEIYPHNVILFWISLVSGVFGLVFWLRLTRTRLRERLAERRMHWSHK